MKKYIIFADCAGYEETTVYTEKEAIEEFAKATAILNNEMMENYLDYENREEEDRNMSFEDWVAGTDRIWCTIIEE